jgi:hypothetical protein
MGRHRLGYGTLDTLGLEPGILTTPSSLHTLQNTLWCKFRHDAKL